MAMRPLKIAVHVYIIGEYKGEDKGEKTKIRDIIRGMCLVTDSYIYRLR